MGGERRPIDPRFDENWRPVRADGTEVPTREERFDELFRTADPTYRERVLAQWATPEPEYGSARDEVMALLRAAIQRPDRDRSAPVVMAHGVVDLGKLADSILAVTGEQVAAVRALHSPRSTPHGKWPSCAHDGHKYPCGTIRAMDGES